ncbi:hypothetical protein AMATHDRAFT_164401 [Amanita thiersii Skay4041]|uniref:Aminotransferase class V domain-containing protein n=1 Tax=Amanita thiersii Skay4041 TaxID=703135 RepID=A0A2A9N5Y0_9AGAR|nr:hypothetical protein AMATHDRAFT_164401 [Amanita thiersii Skay4041]
MDTAKFYAQAPPKFGRDLRKYFALDPNYVNLNHGSYGSTPLPVLQACEEISREIESNPDKFHRLNYQARLISVREKLAKLIGAKTHEVVLVANASMGINTILRNIQWEKGDSILVTTTTYGSVFRTSQHLSNILPNPHLSVLTLNFPLTHGDIVSLFRERIRALPPGKNRIAIVDSIVSNPGVLLPWKEMVNICREEGVLSVVDAAHSIGQELHINLEEAKPDFWVSNCHKWLYAKRSCAVLYIPERNQHIVQSSIPTSHAYRPLNERKGFGLVEQFEWNGTIDWAPFLTVDDSFAFRAWLGGEEVINEYCHGLALQGGRRLAEILGTKVLDPQGDLTVNMVNVKLPLPNTSILPYSDKLDITLKQKMLNGHNAYSAHFPHNGEWWTRCSAQTFNEISDFEKLGEAWLVVCKEILEEYGLPAYYPMMNGHAKPEANGELKN